MYENVEQVSKKFQIYDFPLNIVIEPCNFCNLDCIMCAHDKLTRKKGKMDIRLYKRIIDEIALENPNTRIWLDFYGEPLLLQFKLFYLIKYAKKKGLSNVCVNTNGTLLTEEISEMLIDSEIDFISIDCDGFSKEVYEKIRVNANRDDVYKNIEYFADKLAQCHKKGIRTPIVEVKIMEMEENKHEIELVMDYWRKRGLWTTKRRLISWAASSENIHIDVNIQRQPCAHAIGIFVITWDGKATNCVMDVDGKFICGDVRQESIKSIWQRRNRTLIEKHMNHKWSELPDICKKCSDWFIVGEERFDENGIPVKKNYDKKKEMLEYSINFKKMV